MSVLSFDPAGHGGVSTVGADPTPSWSLARNKPPTLAIPIPASGDVTPADDGPIVAIVNPDSEKQPMPRGRTLHRSNSSPSPSSSPSSSPSRLRRVLITGGKLAAVAAGTALGGPVGGGAVAGFLASRGGDDGRQQQNTAPEFDDSDAGSAHATNECSEKAGTVVSKIAQGNESLYEIIGDMKKRIATHKEISERVRAMKEELERLREAANNLPQPTTPDGIAQKALATAAIESCTANLLLRTGMRQAPSLGRLRCSS